MEELLEKYKGAYASDIEEPLASPESSEGSEGSEDEEEEETEGDESDDASSGKVEYSESGLSFKNTRLICTFRNY